MCYITEDWVRHLTTLRIRGVFDTNLADKKRNPNPNVQRLSEKRPLDARVMPTV